jgi:ubiquinone/menaquinone biosynthesis C-methylase UbiE
MQSILPRSGYINIDQVPEPERYIRQLDEVGASDFWQEIKALMMEKLDLHPGDRVLDVGCGAGNDVVTLAKLVQPTGRAIGVDSSHAMIQAARQRAQALELPISYETGDAQQLNFPDNQFDACRVERVLQHLDHPQQALAELLRVLRPGGRLAIVEPDYGMTAIAGADPKLTQILVQARCNHFQSGRIGLLMPLLLKQLNAIQISTTKSCFTQQTFDADHRQFLQQKYTQPAQTAGLISAAAANHWLTQLEQAAAGDRYHHTVTVFIVSACKPCSNSL